METIATYLFRSSVWLTGFALVYILFLRNERFFKLNRFFLVLGILASIVFPFFTWHYTVVFPVMPSAEVSEPTFQGTVSPESESFSTGTILLLVYLSGMTYLIYRLVKQTLAVWMIIRKSKPLHFNSAKLIHTDQYPASFSFFSFVFVNPSIDETETCEIVNHEQEHIRQRHWIDLMLFEILCTMQWFNPAIWLYGRFIRQNHEYMADEAALQRTSNPAVYRAALLNQMFGGPVISLANSFNYSINKKRFTMMKHTIQSPFRKLKLLMILPMIAGVFYAFAAPEYQFAQVGNNQLIQEGKTITGKVTDDKGEALPGASVVVSGKPIGTQTDINGNFKLELTDDSPIVISFVGFESQKVNPDFEKEMLLTLKTIVIGIDAMGNDVSATKTQSSEEPRLIIIDGKESSKEEMNAISPAQIDKFAVLNSQMAVDKYGEKAKNGVIEITLKPNNETSIGSAIAARTDEPLKIGSSNGQNQPLVVVDGKITENKDLNNITPENIESISVLKNQSATALYGDKGKNGVVQIFMKKEVSMDKNTNGTTLYGNFTNKPSNGTKEKSTGLIYTARNIQGTVKNGNTIIKADSIDLNFAKSSSLFFIDGKESTKAEVDQLNPDKIESVSILKNEFAVSKYGEKGKKGVVEIALKKEQEIYSIAEEMPQFPGGVEALKAYVASSLQYPTIALENRIQGRVFVSFVVDKNGNVTNAKLSRGVDPAIDEEALRIVKSMPIWNPGKQNGECVEVTYEMPINFKIPADEKLKTTRGTYFSTRTSSTKKTLQLGIVPNPTSADARITLDGSGSTNKLEISVYDSSGKLFKNASKNGQTFSLSINNLPPGNYLVVGKDDENKLTVTSQLVVNH